MHCSQNFEYVSRNLLRQYSSLLLCENAHEMKGCCRQCWTAGLSLLQFGMLGAKTRV